VNELAVNDVRIAGKYRLGRQAAKETGGCATATGKAGERIGRIERHQVRHRQIVGPLQPQHRSQAHHDALKPIGAVIAVPLPSAVQDDHPVGIRGVYADDEIVVRETKPCGQGMIEHIGVVRVQGSRIPGHERQTLVSSFQELDAQVLGPHFHRFPHPRLLFFGNQVREGIPLGVKPIDLTEVVEDRGHAVLDIRPKVGIDVLFESTAHFQRNVAMPWLVPAAGQVEIESLRIDRRSH